MRILAADVGGTHTRIGLVEANARPPSVRVLTWHVTPTPSRASPVDALVRFLEGTGASPDAVAVAVAGPVHDGTATLTNVGRPMSRRELSEVTGVEHVFLINDFEALGFALTVLEDTEG